MNYPTDDQTIFLQQTVKNAVAAKTPLKITGGNSKAFFGRESTGKFVKELPEHDELEIMLRSCVHCGFCNAAYPTFQLSGNELDGPRGRIYLLKQTLEGQTVSRLTR